MSRAFTGPGWVSISSPSRRAISRGARRQPADRAPAGRVHPDRTRRPGSGRSRSTPGDCGRRRLRIGRAGLPRSDSRWPTGNRCSVEASTSRTKPEGSSLAIAANSLQQVSGQLDVRPAAAAVDRVDRQGVGQKPDGPRSNGFMFVPEQPAQERASVPPITNSEHNARIFRDGSGSWSKSVAQARLRFEPAARPGSIAPPGLAAPCGRTIRSGG